MLLYFTLLYLFSVASSNLNELYGPELTLWQEDFPGEGAKTNNQPSFSDQSDLLDRQKREVEFSGSGEDEIVDTSSCSYTVNVSPFVPFSFYLDTQLLECIQEDHLNGLRYNYTLSSPSFTSFKTYTTHTSLFPADHLKLQNEESVHTINVTANCSTGQTCDYPSLSFSLSLTLSSDYDSRLFPFGVRLSDEALTGVDDSYVTVVVNGNKPIPIFDEEYRKLYISSNGLVSLTRPYINWEAVPFPYGQTQVPILAPFWTDFDFRTSTNTSYLYHNVYTSTDGIRARNILKIASDRVQELTGEIFNGNWVLVSTWFNAIPYQGTERESTSNCTFQLILISNYTATYLLYLYDQTTLGPSSYSPSVAVGYSAGDFVTYYNQDLSSSPQLGTTEGNTGTEGQWAFRVNSNNEKETKQNECLKWVQEEQENNDNSTWINDIVVPCPCSLLQARNDWRFSFTSSTRHNCAVLVTTATRHGLECCYDDEVGGALKVGPNDGGYYHYYHSLFHSSEHQLYDSDPYDNCCNEGTENDCELFYRFRPSSNCSGYVPPTPSFLWGDPHFETADSRNYTFNGVGEYQLLLSTSNKLNVQIRLSKLAGTSATVITAIAIKSHSSQLVQLEINSIGSFVLYLGDNEHLDLPGEGEFLVVTESDSHAHNDLSSVDPTNVNNVYILNINETMIINVGGVIFRVGKQSTFMYVGFELGREFLDSTEGLVGYYDSEPGNDFLLPNGTMLLEEMSEEEIYYNFGLQWQVSESNSIFHYHSQYTYATYNTLATPSFGLSALQSNSTLFAMATTTCEEDYSCLYDVGQTGSLAFGLATHNIRNTNRKTRKDLINFPPNITGSQQITVTVNDSNSNTVIVQYTAVDPDDSTDTIIELKEPVPSGITINSTGHLNIILTTLPTSPLYLTSTDSTNATSLYRISILLCECKNNGTCVTNSDNKNYPLNNNGHYRLMCNCPNGFAGLYCEEDIRGCGYDGCPTYSQCVTNSNSDEGYRCSTECNDGYTANDSDRKCIDVDECSSVSTNNCTQICTNNVGGYECSCRDGYRLNQDDKMTCIDIDECAENIDDCDQYCTNTRGSYNCSCEPLWESHQHTCTLLETCGGNTFCQNLPSNKPHVVKCAILDIAPIGTLTHCTCDEGYWFTSGYECEECPSGKYGFECDKTCNCLNGGTCNSSSGCVCTSGWTGYNCETDINLNSPSFASDTPNSLSLPKLLPHDTPIRYISASDPDGSQVTYQLVSSPYVLPSNTSDGIGVFRINETTGLLETSRNLSSLSITHFLLHVRVSDGSHTPRNSTHLIAVELTADPLPYPLLASPSRSLMITENKPNGTEIYTLNCTEKDSINTEFTRLTLSIISGNTNDTFRINGNKLLTNRSIDYEIFESFSLVFSCKNAFDLTDTISEVILVLNVDDNPFKFDLNTYTVRAYENVTNGYELVTVSASDADLNNATIRYTLSDINHFGGLFSINATSGLLIVNSSISMSPFDRETRDEYIFNITGSLYDSDNDLVETTQTTVNLSLLDVNDYRPLFTSSVYLSANLSQSNSHPETVLFLKAIDLDLGSNSVLSYSLQTNIHFDINTITGEIYVKTSNITKGNYLLQVNATDNGTTPLTGSSFVDIYVRPTPEELLFNARHYYFSFPEDQGPGSTVGYIHAALHDIFNVTITEGSALEAIEYRITNGASSLFHVSSAGHVITTSLLDYENESYYYLEVGASLADFAGVSTATTRVHLSLQDVNDNAPIFQPLSYSKVIYEDSQVGSSVLTVFANDRDYNGQQSVVYSIEESFTGPFNINSTSGEINVDRPLTPHDYHFQVIAIDIGSPISLTSQATVYISIARRHTVRPVLNSTLYIFDMPETYNNGVEAIGYVGAITEGNRSVSITEHGLGFRLVSPEYGTLETTPFVINVQTGALTLSLPLMTEFNYEQQEQFIFYVELYRISDNTTLDTSPIVVMVTDVNDNYPVFSHSFYSSVVPLTTPPHTPVVMVMASDADSEINSELIYSLNSPVIGFHINEKTGTVFVTNSTLKSGDYHMTVVASDKGSPPKNTSVNLTITILPSSSETIVFSSNYYQFELSEDSSQGTQIGQVLVTSVINQTFGLNDITYSLQNSHHCFSINPHNGSLTLTCTNLDRENISNYGLVVVATSNEGSRASVGVNVTVSNVNDHPPQFDRNTYVHIIYTNYMYNESLISPQIIDKDNSNNNIVTFSLTPLSDFIRIERRTGKVYVRDSYINNGSALLPRGDYKFIITAVDSENFALNDTAEFLLTIVERAPKVLSFSSSSLEFSVAENSPGGTLIGSLELLTPQLVNPQDFNGNLHFEILGGDNPDYFHIFDYNATLFLVNDLLDRETSESHVILVRASFLDYHVSVSAYITIIVTDENDNSPRFNQTIYASSLLSDVPINTTVISIYATDLDIGTNEIISYSIVNSSIYFGVDTNTGRVYTLTTPIPESHYKLIVNAVDFGEPRLTSTSVVSVTVEDPLPDSISFEEPNYEFFVTENSLAGTQIGSVSIAQESVALNDLIYSFLTPSDSNLATHLSNFYLDPLSGNITTLASIDREVFSGGVVNIKAHLPSLPSLSATVQVTLTVVDVNDNIPLFGNSVYSSHITEGSIDSSDTILTVSASDEDYGSNADIIFSITSSNFTIGSSTGILKATNEDLTSGSHSITITAKDGGSPSLTGTAQIIITVYAPVPTGIAFTHSSFTQYNYENKQIGSEYARIRLNDIDLTYVSDIQYTLSSDDHFVITKFSHTYAALRNIVELDYETRSRYDLVVTATVHLTGAAISMATATANVYIRLKDLNDNSPIFQNIPDDGHYSASLNENTASNTNIIKLTASDDDSGNNGRVSYSLYNNFTDRFSIDNNGNIKTGTTGIDRETDTKFSLIVNATDSGTPQLYSTAHVLITINDLNDNPPVLVSDNNFVYYFKEETKPSTVLFTAIANDLDSTATLHYSIMGGTGQYLFTINSESGQVRSVKQLDSDDGPSSYTLEIQVSDGTHETSHIFNLNLIDVPYDNRPIFIDFPSSIRLSPYTTPDTNITTFRAKDPDGNDLTYSLITLSDLFIINPNTGLLQSSSVVSNLVPGTNLDLNVNITDDSPYTLSTNATCKIIVLQNLEFINKSYTFSVSESVPTGTIVGILNISDPNLFPNPIVESDRARTYFSFPFPSQPGHVVIETGSELDYEDPEQSVEFTFAIRAEASGYDSQTTLVTIHIVDANDNSPVFVSTSNTFVITESDYTIGRVNATDADTGSNAAITYSIETTPFFTIDQNTGIITRSQSLTTGVHTVTVIATDQGTPPRNTTKIFTVQITGASTGSTDIVPYILVVIVTVICVGLILALCVLSVLLTRKRRERVKKKNRDPYLDQNINENWKLSASRNDWKSNNFEMKGKNNDEEEEEDTAYQTMYEDHLLDIRQMPWADPGYKDKKYNETTDLTTDDGSSDITASISTDLRHSTEQVIPSAERRLSLAGSQKDEQEKGGGEKGVGPISRRGRRASGDESNSDLDLDTKDYLQQYQSTSLLLPGERPVEYDIFLKPDPDKPPPGTRPSLRNALWPHGPNQVNLPLPRDVSNTKL